MFQGLQESQIAGAVEAMLFVTDEPVGVITLADMLEVDPKLVEAALIELAEGFERDGRGIQLREVAGGWRLYTHPAYHELVEKYVLSWDTRKLSQAALETLAIVAYMQPCTRATVASVRGVNSDSSINSLVEKGLVREAGQADTPGNPMLYATTRGFLEKFGLRSVADLPDLDLYAPDDATRALIRERLSAPGEGAYATPDAAMGDGEFGGGESDAAAAADAAANATPNAASAAGLDAPASDAAQRMLADAMAGSFGLVDKIDFDSLTFDTDDE